MARGWIALDQIQDVNRLGDGSRFATTNGGFTAGNVIVSDSSGKLVDGGSAAANPGLTFFVGDGSVNTNVLGIALPAARTGHISRCLVTVGASDASIPLTFQITQNGTDIFTSAPSIAAGAAADSQFSFTGFTTAPLPTTQDDKFKLNITSGGSAWKVVIVLE